MEAIRSTADAFHDLESAEERNGADKVAQYQEMLNRAEQLCTDKGWTAGQLLLLFRDYVAEMTTSLAFGARVSREVLDGILDEILDSGICDKGGSTHMTGSEELIEQLSIHAQEWYDDGMIEYQQFLEDDKKMANKALS